MEAISISTVSETQFSVSPGMFGANFLSTFYAADDQMFELFDYLNVTNLRYPGGLVEYSFSIYDPNRTIDDAGRTMTPLNDFLDACLARGIGATVIIPTRNLLGGGTDTNGYRLPDMTEINATIEFIENMLLEYSHLGNAELLRLIESIEIGNEYWGSGQMTATEYGRIVNVLVPRLYDALVRIVGQNGAEEIDLLVQMGAPWSRDYDDGGRIREITKSSDPALLSELGLGPRDFDESGNLNWRSIVDLENRLIVEELSPETRSRIGGLVEHFYFDTPNDIISYSSSNLIYLDRDIRVWESAGFQDTPINITEWNIQTSNYDQLGLRGGGAFLIQFSFMIKLGVDTAYVWPIQHNTITDLAGSVGGVDQYSASAYIFQHLSEHIAGMNLVEIATSSTNYQIVSFEDDQQTILYIISRTGQTNDVSIDLTRVLGTESSWSLASVEIVGVDMSTSDGSHIIRSRRIPVDPYAEHDARAQIETLSENEVLDGGRAEFELEGYEIAMLVIDHAPRPIAVNPPVLDPPDYVPPIPEKKIIGSDSGVIATAIIDCSEMFEPRPSSRRNEGVNGQAEIHYYNDAEAFVFSTAYPEELGHFDVEKIEKPIDAPPVFSIDYSIDEFVFF